jgi:hypothetical protein
MTSSSTDLLGGSVEVAIIQIQRKGMASEVNGLWVKTPPLEDLSRRGLGDVLAF